MTHLPGYDKRTERYELLVLGFLQVIGLAMMSLAAQQAVQFAEEREQLTAQSTAPAHEMEPITSPGVLAHSISNQHQAPRTGAGAVISAEAVAHTGDRS